MGVKVTMDSGAAYVAHEARTEGTHNAQPVTVYVVREAGTGAVVGEVRREARPSMSSRPGMDVLWVHASGEADALWRAVRAMVGGKVVNVETTDDATVTTAHGSVTGPREYVEAAATIARESGMDAAVSEPCVICGKPSTHEVQDVNASGPWVAVCGDACGDAVVTHAPDCDCTNCTNEREPAPLRARLAENGRAVHVWWFTGTGVAPSRQRVAAVARAESGGFPIRHRQTFAESGRTTVVYSRDAR